MLTGIALFYWLYCLPELICSEKPYFHFVNCKHLQQNQFFCNNFRIVYFYNQNIKLTMVQSMFSLTGSAT
jgi:hypothetical protein